MKLYSLTTENLTVLANDIKDRVIRELWSLPLGDTGQSFEDISGRLVVAVHEPGFLGTMFAKRRGIDLESKAPFHISVIYDRKR